MRFFNTAGPVNCADHYCLPPLERFNLEEVLFLIAQKKYFVLHAPRFDRTPDKSREEKIFRREEAMGLKRIEIWGM